MITRKSIETLRLVRNKPLFHILLFSIQCAIAFGQSSSSAWEPDNAINFFTYPALPHNVHGFAQDKYGYMWFGSTDGLYRFDGVTYKRYTHIESDPYSIGANFCYPYLADSYGMLWLRTAKGLSILNTSTYKFRNFNFSDTLFNDFVNGVAEDSINNIWISSSGRKNLTRYEPAKDKFTAYTIPDFIYRKGMRTFGLTLNPDGNIYLGADFGVIIFDPRTEKHEKMIPQIYTFISDSLVYRAITQSIQSDKSGNLYAGNWIVNDGYLHVGVYDRKRQCLVYSKINVGTKFAAVFCIAVKSENELWIGTDLGGLFVYNKKTKQVRLCVHKADDHNSFPEDLTENINSIFKDHTGCFWISTGNIMVKADPLDQTVKRYNFSKLVGEKDKPGFAINSVVKVPEENKLLIGTWQGAGLYKVDLKRKTIYRNTTYRDDEQKICGIQQIVLDHRGGTWCYSQKLILHYESTNGKFIPCKVTPAMPEANFSFTSMMEDKQGHFWLGSYRHGIFAFNPEDNSCIRYPREMYNKTYAGSDMIKCCFEDEHENIWCTTFDGTFLFNLKNKTFTRISYKPNDKPYNDGRDLLKDKKGNIWRSSARGGFQKYNPRTGMFELVMANIDTRQIIMDGMTEDNRGYIWISADEEICRFDPQHNQFLFPKQTMHLEMGTQIIGFCKDNGTLYTSGGPVLYETNTNLFNGNTHVPEIVFNNFKVQNRDTTFSENLNDIKTITLPYDKNFISLEFAALNFSHSENNQYAYKLDGIDKVWVMSENKNSASFSNLDPGKYVFHVEASNNTGLWNETGKSLVIIITAPWWQRWWFRLSMAGMAIVVLLLGMRLYTVRKLRKQKTEFEKQQALDQERSRISRDLHDEVGSTLSSINIIANMDEKSAMQPEEKLQRIRKQTHSVLEKMREIIWMMNPANNSFENIFTHIKEYASELLEAKNIEFGFHTEGDFSAIYIPVEQRRDLYLIMKEAINNLAKYSECTRTDLCLTVENSKLIMKVTDNGKGFDDAMKASGNGLVNMRKRAETLNAIIQIDSELNKGTSICLIMPIA